MYLFKLTKTNMSKSMFMILTKTKNAYAHYHLKLKVMMRHVRKEVRQAKIFGKSQQS